MRKRKMGALSRRSFLGLTGAGLAAASLPAFRMSKGLYSASPGANRLVDLAAGELAARIRNGEISSEEVVQAHLERIEAVNSVLNAVVRLNERALEQARAADRALGAGQLVGALHGVPITVKDSHDVGGMVSTGGTQGRADYVPDASGTAVRRLQAAGAIVIGRTNTPELTLSFDTVNALYGRTWNPYDPILTPGGSSGGAAAIIAASGSPLDLGSDTGGSIRLPSHFCGIAGIKPTSGRVPRTGHIISFDGLHQSLTQIGPMARTVDDLALVLPLIAGPDGVDPHVAPVPLGDPAAVDVSALRIAYHLDNGIVTPTGEIMATVRTAARAMESAAAEVTEAVPPGLLDYAVGTDGLWMGDEGSWARRILEAAGTVELSAEMATGLEGREPISSAELTRLLELRDRFRSEALGFWEQHDVLLCPVNAYPALKPGEWWEMIPAFSYTYLYNELGWPGAVVRCGATASGLPIGVQVLAAPWREDRCLAVARHLEREFGGWRPVEDALIVS
ncbi:MAG: amidase [Gemmatimonadota bacterium]|nr:MAG: amidase [Gemmatimonadota bacterium]